MTERKKQNKNHVFGLLGKDISYSFSNGYFNEKFDKLQLKNHKYQNFDIPEIADFMDAIAPYKEQLKGLNVTIPYKETIFTYLDKIDKKAAQIGAVNTIKITKKGNLKGYNTDVYGFKKSLQPLLESHHKKALILGTGGASKAVAFALKKLEIDFKFVSRNPSTANQISYSNLSEEIITAHKIIINCTPLGTFPETKLCPKIPYQLLTTQHLLYDLIYNPSITTFLENGKNKGAKIKNGLEMLQLQAEKSWQIWNR